MSIARLARSLSPFTRATRLAISLLAIAVGAHAASVPAFPEACGGGAASVGGRGGRVIEVTNLNDSGVGSLRDAMETQSGPRTVVFRVAGVIVLQDHIQINNPYLTVAGQTAPGSGVTLTFVDGMNREVDLIRGMTHDVVLRYLRLRPGQGNGVNQRSRGGLGLLGDCTNIVIDHLSSEWSMYDNLGTWSNLGIQHHVSFQYNISAEGLSVHSKGFNTGSDSQTSGARMVDIDLHHNLFMSNSNRNPLMRDKQSRIVNNLIYNSNYGDITLSGGITADVIANKITRGPSFDGYDTHEIQWEITGESDAQPGDPSIYLAGNLGPHNPGNLAADNWTMMNVVQAGEYHSDSGLVNAAFRRSAPLSAEPFPIPIDSAADLDTKLLPILGAYQRLDATGAWVPARDAVDQRLIHEYQTGGGRIPTSDRDVGGFPAVIPGAAYADSDHDGMPDAWETAHGLNPNNAADGAVISADGYSNLEHFLDGIGSSSAIPVVSLSAPQNGAVLVAPATVLVAADASVSSGSITQVEFFQGGTLLGTSTSAPYAITWSNVGVGTYTFTARATTSSGATVTSTPVTASVSSPAPPPAGWSNHPLTAQGGTFTTTFDAVPGQAGMDGVVGLSHGSAAATTDLACIIRFNDAGRIDARNGAAYAASASVAYSAGASYRFRLVVNAPSHRYDIYVTAPGGAEQTLGIGFGFRSEQAAITSVDNWAVYAFAGSISVTNVSVSAVGPIVLLNPGFEADRAEVQQISGWSTWIPTGGSSMDADFTEAWAGAHGGQYHGTHWKTTPYEVYTYQTLSGLSAGSYTLKAWVRGSGGQANAQMEAKDYGGGVRTAAIPRTSSWVQISIPGIAVTNGQCLIGFYSRASANQWIHFDDVTFTRDGQSVAAADATASDQASASTDNEAGGGSGHGCGLGGGVALIAIALLFAHQRRGRNA